MGQYTQLVEQTLNEGMEVGKSSFYNSYEVDGKNITDIHFFKDGKILFSAERGWLMGYSKAEGAGATNVKSLKLSVDELKNKRVVKLTDKIPFISGKEEAELYIPADSVKFKDMGENVYLKNDKETIYHNYYSISGLTPKRIFVSKYSRSEKTKSGNEIDKLAKKMSDLNINIGSYELGQLLTHFKLTPRK